MGVCVRLTLAAAAAATVALLPAPSASAQGLGRAIRLEYDAADGCPSRAAFLDGLQARLEHSEIASDDAAATTHRVTLKSGDPATGHLESRTADGATTSRDLHGATCSEVANALELVLALDVDGSEATPTPTPTPATAPTPVLPPTFPPASLFPPAPRDLPSRAHPIAPSRWTLSGSVGLAATGILAGPEAFLEAAALPVGHRAGLVLVVDARLGVSQGWSYPATTPSGARFSRTTSVVDLCLLRLSFDAFAGSLCARAEAGVLDASGTIQTPRPWLATGAMVVTRWTLADPFFLQLEGGAVAPLVRDRFLFDDPPSLAYAVPPVDARSSLAAGMRFR